MQAFDAADEYLLNHVAEHGLTLQTRVLVLNDNFGARAGHQPRPPCNSHQQHRFVSWGAGAGNQVRNGHSFDAVPVIPASEPLTGTFDWVLIRVPKTLALLEEQLIRLQGKLPRERR